MMIMGTGERPTDFEAEHKINKGLRSRGLRTAKQADMSFDFPVSVIYRIMPGSDEVQWKLSMSERAT